ncbi:MAG TPA: metalloregulator ArsR/SmtB family transcription factor [Rhizomicrobium sp.]
MTAFAALADPVRNQIVAMLAARDMPAGDIAARFDVSRPAVSRHLSVLLKANLVQVREQAQMRVYSLNPKGLNEVDDWVAQCRQTWNARLDALGRQLDALAERKRKGAKP